MRAGKYESKAERDFYLERIGRSKAALLDELWRVASEVVRCGECWHKMGNYCHCNKSHAFGKYVASNDYCRHATTEAEE